VSLRIVVISDTHSRHRHIVVPDGDVLVHAGDLTARGTLEELQAFDQWLGTLPHAHKLVIAGNHDWVCAEAPSAMPLLLNNATYLCDTQVTIAGIRFYGSPWQPRFMNWAFNLDPPALRQVWANVPEGVDVLITHTPPLGMRDRTFRGEHVGCGELAAALPRIRPRLHCFGHIHEAYGQHTEGGTIFVNGSCCTLQYQPINPAQVFTLD
jgi:Icc-related predicted phosphoesterase